MNADGPIFLDVDDVLDIHAAQLELFGGGTGVRDLGLLESAVAQPQASFGGEFAHDGLYAMAAAYLFHIVSNHPFVDGNKRAGLLSALVFRDLNGISIDQPSDALYELTIGVAEGRHDKVFVAADHPGRRAAEVSLSTGLQACTAAFCGPAAPQRCGTLRSEVWPGSAKSSSCMGRTSHCSSI